ncbi:MAG: DUF1573 domain-containing protein [Candidatus Kapaibacterium sp.]|nr:MAG: DUF1573 domain-containing protein [Candidatus Kapabacteria bacterium]
MKNFAQTLASALLVSVVAATSAFAQPKIEIKGGDTFDWGTVNDVSKPLAGQVEIKNIGDKDLLIYQTKPACGCTSDALDKGTLKPGESTMLRFSVNVGSTTGQLLKSITVTTNAAPDSVKVVFLKANIQRLLSVDPQFISFYPLWIGKESTTMAKIKNNGKDPVKVLEFTVNNGLTIGKKAPFTIPANSEVEIPIKVVGPAQAGPFYGTVLAKTDSKAYPLLEIRAYGDIKPAPTPAPASSPAMLPTGGGQ